MELAFTSVGEPDDLLPMKYALHQNCLNPFNPSTRIEFDLVVPQAVTFTVCNVLGQQVRPLISGQQFKAGYHMIQFDTSDLASGV